MKKVIFISHSLQDSRSDKIINNFIDNGFDIEVYGYVRNPEKPLVCERYTPTVLGTVLNGKRYFMRILPMLWSFYQICRKSEKDAVYYLFGLNIAMLFTLTNRKSYIYDECDLAHTYIRSKLIRNFFEILDKKVICNSLETVFTSEGFYRYHFGDKKLNNISIIANKLNKKIRNFCPVVKQLPLMSKLRIGFVGATRFNSVLNFSSIFITRFPQHEFHFFGNPVSLINEFEKLKRYPNVFFHGQFANPEDLPAIYSQIDLVLSTYDVEFENVRYAEPNKIYEAIYFKTPIIVSKGTFLSEKVNNLNIGYSINPLNNDEIVEFINGLTVDSIQDKINSLNCIPCEEAIDESVDFFYKIKSRIL